MKGTLRNRLEKAAGDFRGRADWSDHTAWDYLDRCTGEPSAYYRGRRDAYNDVIELLAALLGTPIVHIPYRQPPLYRQHLDKEHGDKPNDQTAPLLEGGDDD